MIDNVENWSFIKFSDEDKKFVEKYKANSEDIKCYYRHDIAERRFGERFWFDKGLVFRKEGITNKKTEDNFELIAQSTTDKTYNIPTIKKFISKDFIGETQGFQGWKVFEAKYKIIWYCMNFLKFYFSKEKIMTHYEYSIITSNNKNEMLFLYSNNNTNK